MRLVRWGIVTHGCVDGLSHLVTYLNCSTDNRHVALFMNLIQGIQRSSHITGEYVHFFLPEIQKRLELFRISSLLNSSLLSGCFPSAFKQAAVIPLLKKPTLDPTSPQNYRPVSLLPFLSKLGHLIATYGFSYHFYADDAQIFLSSSDPLIASRISYCLSAISAWIHSHHLRLNLSKSDLLFFLHSSSPSADLSISIPLECTTLSPSSSAKNLGLLVQSLVLSRLLQLIQNSAARLVFSLPRFTHATPLLPISARIQFKTLTLTYRCLDHTAPSYLQSLISPYIPSRPLRSSSARRLTLPPLHDYLQQEAKKLGGFDYHYWIGLSDLKTEGDWRWVDNTPVNLTYWADTEPDNHLSGGLHGEDCAVLNSHTRSWHDVPCEFLYPAICETSALTFTA
ncbi:PGCA protein, partial [Amia calva]|nr:PGCA protein [Amia calva]